MNKKIFIIITVSLLIFVFLGAYFLITRKKTVLPEGKIEIQTKTELLPVNDPHSNPDKIITPNDIVIKRNPEYQILFFEYGQEKSFLISISGGDPQVSRDKAEADFLATLDITKEQACKLTVSMAVSKDISPSLAGQEFGLSFCPNGKPFSK